MNGKAVAYAIGKLMQLTGIILCIPLGIAVYNLEAISFASLLDNVEAIGFSLAIIASIVGGTIISLFYRADRNEQGIREGYAIVSLGWIILAFFGSIPFTFYFIAHSDGTGFLNLLTCFTDGYFEIMSGFTTTGSTILTDIEAIPDSLLFWRSLTHWLGGMGIITLALAIFPAMGVSGYQMFRGEIPGPTADRLRPRLAQTAAILWGVYALLSGVETLLLWLGGMPLFDSLCHTFGTMATGGFSTQNSSIAAYNSAYFEWVIIIFMYLAGVNFLLHFNVLRGKWRQAIINREFIFYTGIIICVTLFLSGVLYGGTVKSPEDAYSHYRHDKPTSLEFDNYVVNESQKFDNLHDCVRTTMFQVVAITTTTGYGTADFDIWPDIGRFVLLLLMFFGGCAGSTGGGMKQVRILILIKNGWRELRKLTRPNLIAPLRMGPVAVEEDKIANITAFFILFMLLFAVASLIMTLFVPDLLTAVSATIACINNIGPGLNGVGSIENYSWIPIPGKWVLIACMLLGRLEIFTVLIVFRPSFWK
ncbi:MAG: TrkH family potassium uptake protein [candidate division Zixibacteria bacterium]|nr:TrkH family potassium uptake protein [candidate division Zixibacteria bacterium]